MVWMICKKWDVVLIDLNSTKGSEISKIRPYLIVSPNSVNTYMNTVVIVPFTSKPKFYPFRIATKHKEIDGELCFDYIKSVDKSRIVKPYGTIDKSLRPAINNLLFEFFGE
jgi:mRNA interferase MazF